MKVRIELFLELDAKDLVALATYFRTNVYGSTPTFGEGQQNIEANRALQSVVGQLRRELEER